MLKPSASAIFCPVSIDPSLDLVSIELVSDSYYSVNDLCQEENLSPLGRRGRGDVQEETYTKKISYVYVFRTFFLHVLMSFQTMDLFESGTKEV